MKSLGQVGAILLLLVFSVAPAMACMAPDAQMTAQERACCGMMKSQCGQMEMPTSEDCCKKASSSDHESAVKTETASSHPTAFVAMWVSAFEVLAPQGMGYSSHHRPDHSPPKSPPSAITILRI